MSVSEQLRGFAESAYEVKDIPLHVKHDLDVFAMDVYEIEHERDERKVVTCEEHARVVHLYIDMIANKASENAKLRKAARDAWSLFVRFGAVHPHNLPEVDRVRESLQELGIEVNDEFRRGSGQQHTRRQEREATDPETPRTDGREDGTVDKSL